jgi:hypothetical protein
MAQSYADVGSGGGDSPFQKVEPSIIRLLKGFLNFSRIENTLASRLRRDQLLCEKLTHTKPGGRHELRRLFAHGGVLRQLQRRAGFPIGNRQSAIGN